MKLKMILWVAAQVFFVLNLATHVQAQQLKIDDFVLIDAQGENFHLADHQDQKAVVIFMTSSNCVFATKYEDRINALYEAYQSKDIGFVAVNSNDPSISDRDDVKVMRQYAPFPFPYVKDEAQIVAKLLGAETNPEVFILLPTVETFELAYRGQIDDSPLSAERVEVAYVQQALEAILADTDIPTTFTEAKGCPIRWKSE
ncbi:MAG: thioredoxin family protein [Bacteroidota bacterium]